MDAELAELNRKLGGTLVAYGEGSLRRSVVAKQAAAESAPTAVAADRLAFNARYGRAVQGEGELLDALARGEVKLESVRRDQLPEALQKLDDPALRSEIEKRQRERAELQARIREVSRQREEFIAAEQKKLAATGDSFDARVAESIRAQAARKGITYE